MNSETIPDRLVETRDVVENGVGPILRKGEIAEAAIDAILDDNPDKQVFVTDRGDYIRITTLDECRLTRASFETHLGRDYALPRLEIEMPSYAGQIATTDAAYRWFNKGK